ncbi:putative cyclin-D6-1 [Glycine max]|nr:putative cyclin-D6-1 [Glycine max]
MEFDLEDPLVSLEEEQTFTISELFASESEHVPSPNCLTSTHFRVFCCEAISLILQVQVSCKLDPFVAYLAINYLHRFMSSQEIPQGKPWFLRLVVISCLSLASKMKNTTLSFLVIQKEGCYFKAQSIQRMELLILGALKWRMRSITPFSFLHFFISLAEIKDQSLKQALKSRASEIIFNAQNDIKLLEYKPSTVAATALIFASHELFPQQYSILRASITASEYLDGETLSKCFDLMQDMMRMEAKELMIDTSFLSTETPKKNPIFSNLRRRKLREKENNHVVKPDIFPQKEMVKF